MILIGDSGSTKTQWVKLSSSGIVEYSTQGIYPMLHTQAEIEGILTNELLPQLDNTTGISKICFYGTAVSSEERTARVKNALSTVLPNITSEVNHDLLGAARALCGKQKGIACILGTGSNSCVYDGENIIENIPSLGYVLGDEGSGAHLGKTLLAEYFYDTLPHDLKLELDKFLDKTKVEVLDFIYRQPLANRYLAELALFMSEHKHRPEIQNIIKRCFASFIINHILPYNDSEKLPVHCVGSVGFGFADEFKSVLADKGLAAGKIIKSPMEGLIDYHKKELFS